MWQAIQFLTVLPVPATSGAAPLGRASWAFAVVGALLGVLAASCWHWGGRPMGPLLALAALALCTGGLHEDGLADVFDAVRAGRSRKKILAILDDSRIGAHGALALIIVLAWRWQALASLQGDAWWRLPAVFGISRAAMVVLASIAPPTGSGLGRGFSESLPRGAGIAAAVQCVLLAAFCGFPAGAAVGLANATLLLILRQWFRARLGGVTGDCLGAACQLSEAVSLGVLTCL